MVGLTYQNNAKNYFANIIFQLFGGTFRGFEEAKPPSICAYIPLPLTVLS